MGTKTAATRAAAGFGRGGRVIYLKALDGGGSTTLVARDPGPSAVTVRNHPSGGAERPVANAIGVFASL